MVCLSSVTIAVLMLLAFRQNVKEVMAWCLALLAGCVALGALALRNIVPEVGAIILVNVALAAGIAAQGAALDQFEQRKSPVYPFVVLGGIAVAVSFVSNTANRVAIFGLIFGSGYIWLAIKSNRLATASRVARAIMMVSFGLATLLFLMRTSVAMLNPSAMQVLTAPNVWQSLTMAASFLVVTCSSFGYLLLYKERADQHAARLATTDALTGALNRRMLSELGERALARSRRRRLSMSVVMLDIDHFKTVNDRHGHAVGDLVLQRFVEVLQRELRTEDVLIRYGGEEFCLLLPEQPRHEARAVAERLRAAIQATNVAADDKNIAITLSAGVAAFEIEDLGLLQKLLEHADAALFTAKRNGRNRVEVHHRAHSVDENSSTEPSGANDPSSSVPTA